jgi:microcystin-dependent protein
VTGTDSSWRWATVTTAGAAMRITLDGDTAALPFTPDSLVDPLALPAGSRVRCEITGHRVIIHGRAQGDQMMIGELRSFSQDLRTNAPYGILRCAGQAVSRTTYALLFNAIGVLYGAGDGSTTFNIPNLIGRIAIGAAGSSGGQFYTVGATGGEASHVLTVDEMPAHSHKTTTDTNAKAVSTTTGGATQSYDNTASGGYVRNALLSDNDTGSAGSGSAHNNMPPYQVIGGVGIRAL